MNRVLFIACIIIISLLFANSSAAAPVGESAGEIWVNGPADKMPGSDPNQPDADVDASGRRIFVWDTTAVSANRKDIFLRIFPADGGPPADPVQVNTTVEFAQQAPKIAISSDGSFLVVWLSSEPPEPGDNFQRAVVRSQAFDVNGNPLGNEQLLSTLDPLLTTENKVDVAALPDTGSFRSTRS
jgi:hypothetical protein